MTTTWYCLVTARLKAMPHKHDIVGDVVVNDYQGWGSRIVHQVHQVQVQCRILHQVDQVLAHQVQVQYMRHF